MIYSCPVWGARLEQAHCPRKSEVRKSGDEEIAECGYRRLRAKLGSEPVVRRTKGNKETGLLMSGTSPA